MVKKAVTLGEPVFFFELHDAFRLTENPESESSRGFLVIP